MKIVILGGGPAGLYAGILIKKANPAHDITIIERNPADVTYGWGVVFSDRTLASFQRADFPTYQQIANRFVIWDAIDTRYRGETIRCGGHIIASISRKALLRILQRRCAKLGVTIQFNREIKDLISLPAFDLLIACDGINSLVRTTYAPIFKPTITPGKARYIWLGTNKVLDAFTFIFRENEHGLFQVHAYPFSGSGSTFIVECDEASWLKAGLDKADEAQTLAYCEQLFADDLGSARLLSNASRWINFPTLKTQRWQHQNVVLVGDAAHTAHFSIGSGTKLAMEDAIALTNALTQYHDLETALKAYEMERQPVVETFQRAAQESQTYFETLKRYLGLDPLPFTFQLLTRSGRITYDDLRLRDARFGEAIDRWFAQQNTRDALQKNESAEPVPHASRTKGSANLTLPVRPQSKASGALKSEKSEMNHHQPQVLIAPPPLFAPLKLRGATLPNRAVCALRSTCPAEDGAPNDSYLADLGHQARGGVGLVLTPLTAVSAGGRITPDDPGIYTATHKAAWARIVDQFHAQTTAKIALRLGHAGRRGATRPRAVGLDRPLSNGGWPLLSASPLPYTLQNQTPKAMDRADMDEVRDDFARAARMADEAGFDMLSLNVAHGYLLASFLSPLTNLRGDEYGGALKARLRFPLEVFDAVRAAWPEEKPLAVVLSVTDCTKGGFTVEDAIVVAQTLKARGCDLIEVLAGHTIPDAIPTYRRGFLTSLSDRVRNEAGISTMVGGYLTTTDEVNTILAACRADLCIMEPRI